MPENPNLHPQDVLVLLFSQPVSHEEACGLVASSLSDSCLTFFLFPITFFQALMPPFLSHKYPQPLAFREADLRLVPQAEQGWLGCLGNKPFLCHRPQQLSVWLSVHSKQAGPSSSSHGVRSIHLAHTECQQSNGREVVCFSGVRAGAMFSKEAVGQIWEISKICDLWNRGKLEAEKF